MDGALRSVGAGVRSVDWFRSPIVDLGDDPDALRARLGGSFRSTLRRKVKKADAVGLTAEIRRDAAALDEAFEVAVDTWAHREGTGIGSTAENRTFYSTLAAEAEEAGWLRVALLRDAAGAAVAFELNLVRYGEAVNLKLGYRDAARHLSPGLVLRSHVVDALIAEGAATFDLLGIDEPYKLHWTDRTVPHLRLRAFPPTTAGRLRHLYRHRLRPLAASMLSRASRPPSGSG
jgi:CelD/BcsL family acetyltransferase involved in cellulose biosynthesis